MLVWFRRLFSAPVFEDSDKTRRARLLHTVVLTGLGLITSTIIAALIAGIDLITGLAIILGAALLYLVTLFLLRRGYVHTANLLVPSIAWAGATLLVYFAGGIHGLGLGCYIVVILIARLLLGVRAGVDFTLLSIIASLGIFFAEIFGFLPPSYLPDNPTISWMSQTILFLWIAVLLQITNRYLNEALERAQQNERALGESNRELQHIKASLETHAHDLERRIIQLQVASDVARDAASLGKVDELLNRAVNLVRDRFGFYHAGIFMVDERGDYAILRAATGEAGRQMLERRHKLKVGEVGIVGYATGSGLPRLALDVGADAVYFKNPYLPDTHSELALPLKTGDKVIGALDVQSTETAAFDSEDIIILQTMADQLAVAIENARLFEAARRQVEELTILQAVANAGAEATSHDGLIERATQLIGETLYPDHFGIMLIDEASGSLHFHPSYRGLSEDLKKLSVPLGRGISGRVALAGQPIHVSDVTAEREYISVKAQMRCELCVPLKIGDRVIGVINAESAKMNNFTDADERLLATFAGQLATAMEKVRLFEAQRRRATELEALRQASLHLTSNLQLKPLLEAILKHALKLVAADSAVIFLYNGQTLQYGTSLWADKHPNRQLDTPRLHGLTYRVATTGKPMAVSDVRHSILYQDAPWDGALVGLPLRSGSQVIGVMNVAFEGRPHEFDENELSILELLADQAAIGLSNARLYAEAQQRAEELAVALAQREELVRLKSEFIQNVSHELRTPLTIIRGYVELLDNGEMGALQPGQREAITIISRRISMLNKLVEDLTTILETEAPTVEQQPVDLTELVNKAIDDFKDATRHAGLILTTQISKDIPSVMGNPIHLYRLLDNLLGNAIKFTPSGGTITVRLYREDATAVLEVADTGVGIPADKLDRIFERFYQVDGSTTRRYGGTGLGLALVKEIAEAHGGQVTIQSVLDKGSMFRVTLPIPL
jgi:signal transduction histidine kinase/putative methionine-R-sulfoxide reductase with GAF domain